MKKFLFAASLVLYFAAISPSFAASWSSAVNAAISSGKFDQIDVIAAQNPGDAGAIAAFVLQQAENSTGNPANAIKLLNAATPLAGQIPAPDAGNTIAALNALLKLATDPGFQKSNPNGAGQLFADLLNISSQPSIGGTDPHLHDLILTDANDFLNNNPDLDDKKLKDDISLAQGNDFLHNNPDPITNRYTLPNDGPVPPTTPPPPPSAE